uniref:site-specific DNA-methyltransferase (cytosine-N(4)-specific) n=1 Tax=viral metagenome TaxID=1070528 RepID=A0A6C0I637_9ZZZZ
MDAILNRKHALSSLTDAEFEAMLPQLAAELESHGVLYETYSDSEIQKDWALLLKKDVTTNPFNISATEVAGMKVLRKHMRHFHAVRNYKGHSVESRWTQPCLEKALRFNRAQHSTPYASEIIRSLSFANGLGKVTMYRPLMAKKVVSYLANKDGLTDVRVLDVCAGWGGRMIGAKSMDKGGALKVHYTGIDPCAKTYEALRAIRDELELTNVTLINKPAEVALQEMDPGATYDIALTSPPYYNLEIYSDEPTQSVSSSELDGYQTWLNKFLSPVIAGIIGLGVKYSCWSVKNFKTDKKYDLLDDVIRIHGEHGWRLLDGAVFTMANSRRPGQKAQPTQKAQPSTESKKTEECTYVFVRTT